jgi:hypothetical protein
MRDGGRRGRPRISLRSSGLRLLRPFNVPLPVGARRFSRRVAEATRRVPMAHVPSRHVPSRHVPSVHVSSVPVVSVLVGSVSVPSVPMVPIRPVSVPVVPVRSVPVPSAPVINAMRSADMAAHMKSARAAAMKAATSPRHGVGPRQQQTGEANSGDGNNCSRGHQLLDS